MTVSRGFSTSVIILFSHNSKAPQPDSPVAIGTRKLSQSFSYQGFGEKESTLGSKNGKKGPKQTWKYRESEHLNFNLSLKKTEQM